MYLAFYQDGQSGKYVGIKGATFDITPSDSIHWLKENVFPASVSLEPKQSENKDKSVMTF